MEGREDEMYFLCFICNCFCFIILRGSYLLILSSAGLYVGRRDSDTGLYFNCSTSCIMCNYQGRIHSSEVQIHSFVSYKNFSHENFSFTLSLRKFKKFKNMLPNIKFTKKFIFSF